MEIVCLFFIMIALSIIGGIVLAGAIPFGVALIEWIEKHL